MHVCVRERVCAFNLVGHSDQINCISVKFFTLAANIYAAHVVFLHSEVSDNFTVNCNIFLGLWCTVLF